MDSCEKPKTEQELVSLFRQIIAAKAISGDAFVEFCFSVAQLGGVFHSFAMYAFVLIVLVWILFHLLPCVCCFFLFANSLSAYFLTHSFLSHSVGAARWPTSC
jgi:hypothetical protein